MALLPILRFPDPRLHTVARPVAAVDDRVRQLVDDMLQTMYEAEGVGLAATQVDVHERVVVMDTSEKHDQPVVLINPEIVRRSAEMAINEEGCLSVPETWDRVERHARVTVSALGRDGHALLLHCRTQRYEHVPLDRERFEVLVMDTKKPRPLAKTGFNERVHECADALAILRSKLRPEPCLAEYRIDDLVAIERVLTGKHMMRARHVVTEMQRVREAVRCLRANEISGFGKALDASHESTRVDYEVSCPELDVITDAARGCPEVFGARLVGAGFGGCAIALVAPGAAPSVQEQVARKFHERFAVTPGFSVLHAGPGPRECVG